MRLSSKTRYGVRAVLDIAFHSQSNPGIAIQAKDIAEREHIPLRYLESIFQDLRRAGFVDSKRGPRGGYRLKRPANKVTLGDLVSALQGPIEELVSVDEKVPGQELPNSLQLTSMVWQELGTVVSEWFESITLADLVERGNALGLSSTRGETMYFI